MKIIGFEGDREMKPFDKLKVKRYIYQNLGHFLDEYHHSKKDRFKGNENVAQ